METNPLTILCGDALEQLGTLPDESIHCCVTSPPYWGLRDYSTNGQLGLEKTPEEYVAKMVEVFREVRRVLRKDGTLWMNMGDSYWNGGGEKRDGGHGFVDGGKRKLDAAKGALLQAKSETSLGLKPKNLCGIPWRVAFALQADGWWIRSDIIWAKPNPMPESVTDRPTKAHEYLFLLTKSANYFYDAEAIKSPVENGGQVKRGPIYSAPAEVFGITKKTGNMADDAVWTTPTSANKRSVWTVATAPYPEAHFATYPPDLIKPCILAGTSAKGCCAKCGSPWSRVVESESRMSQTVRDETRKNTLTQPNNTSPFRKDHDVRGGPVVSTKTIGWKPTCRCKRTAAFATEWGTPDFQFIPEAIIPCTVLDPFAGSGTTGAVALELGRKAVLIELNLKYVELIKQRCNVTMGLALA